MLDNDVPESSTAALMRQDVYTEPCLVIWGWRSLMYVVSSIGTGTARYWVYWLYAINN